MTEPNLDWTYEDIPREPEPAPGEPGEEQPPRRVARPTIPRRAALSLLALGLAAAFGIGLFQWLGWRRLEQQVAREVAYEDENALAGNATAVVAAQSEDSQIWRDVRQAEAAQRLPATLPAAHLAPAGPARVLRLEPLGGTLFVATVRRRYADALGQAYAFDLAQYYRNLGPGLWERFPPPASLIEQVPYRGWKGERLEVSLLPESEAEALEPVLQQADAWLAQACLDWDCPPGLTMQVAFTSKPADAPSPARPLWEAQPDLGAYPPAFDIAAGYPATAAGYPVDDDGTRSGLVLPALALIGKPAGEAERQVLAEAVAVHGLYYLAAQLSSGLFYGGDPLQAALVARAAARLGLAASAGPFGSPANTDTRGWLFTPATVWAMRVNPEAQALESRARESDAAAQLYALAFLDFVLEGQPPGTDGLMLAAAKRSPDLETWLAAGLGDGTRQLLDRWATAQAANDGGAAIGEDSLDGLIYACSNRLWVAQAGERRMLAADVPLETGFSANFAASDRYLAYVSLGEQPVSIHLLDRQTASTRLAVTGGNYIQLLGWSAAGQLVYVDSLPDGSQILSRYDPEQDRAEHVLEQDVQVDLPFVTNWTNDRQSIGVSIREGQANGQAQWRPAVVRVTDPTEVTYLGPAGSAVTVSPDGRHAAYIVGRNVYEGLEGNGQPSSTLEVVRLAEPQPVALVVTPTLATGQPAAAGFVVWAPDSLNLAYVAGQGGVEMGLFGLSLDDPTPRALETLGPEGYVLPLSFSADGRFLLSVQVEESRDSASDVRLVVFDWQTGRRIAYRPANLLTGFAWSPAGHHLALSTPGGLLVADPASGALRWLVFDACNGVTWPAAPASP